MAVDNPASVGDAVSPQVGEAAPLGDQMPQPGVPPAPGSRQVLNSQGFPAELQPGQVDPEDILIKEQLWPWADLNAAFTPEQWLRMKRDVFGVVALLSVVTPAGPRLAKAASDGTLLGNIAISPGSSVSISGVPQVTVQGNINLAPGSSVSISGVPQVSFAAGQNVNITGNVAVINAASTLLQVNQPQTVERFTSVASGATDSFNTGVLPAGTHAFMIAGATTSTVGQPVITVTGHSTGRKYVNAVKAGLVGSLLEFVVQISGQDTSLDVIIDNTTGDGTIFYAATAILDAGSAATVRQNPGDSWTVAPSALGAIPGLATAWIDGIFASGSRTTIIAGVGGKRVTIYGLSWGAQTGAAGVQSVHFDDTAAIVFDAIRVNTVTPQRASLWVPGGMPGAVGNAFSLVIGAGVPSVDVGGVAYYVQA